MNMLYHFHVRNRGVHCPDVEGLELPNVAAARRKALAVAGQRALDSINAQPDGEQWMLYVTDDFDMVLFAISISETPDTVRISRGAND